MAAQMNGHDFCPCFSLHRGWHRSGLALLSQFTRSMFEIFLHAL